MKPIMGQNLAMAGWAPLWHFARGNHGSSSETEVGMHDDEDVKKKVSHEVGELLDALSIEELEARIGLLQDEITRLSAVIETKKASKSAADSFFKS